MVKHDPNKTRSKKSVKMSLPSENPVLAVFEILARGQLVSQGIFIVAKLRIPDYLSDGGKSVDELANITKTNPNALYRLLRMLASVGIFRETTKVGAGLEQDEQNTVRRFDLTPAASLLLSETTNSVREFALLFGLDSFNRATTNLLHAIETGENSFKYANGLDLFEYFKQKHNKTEAEVFGNAMNCLNLSYVSTIFTLYDFSQFKTILDIGGGEGVFLSTILKKNPNQLGILFDMPKVIQRAKKKYWTSAAKPLYDRDNSLYSRCKLVKGNFFKTIPTGADCNIIKNVILNWDDESAALILKNCLHAMKMTSLTNLYRPGTQRSHPKLLIIETIMPEGNAPFFGKFTDILMLILTRGGRLRTEAELIRLLNSCGFDIVSITKPPDNVSFLSIVEAIPSEEQG